LTGSGYEGINEVPLDHVWTAMRFTRVSPLKGGVKVNRRRAAALAD
jgi:hypothetical protein